MIRLSTPNEFNSDVRIVNVGSNNVCVINKRNIAHCWFYNISSETFYNFNKPSILKNQSKIIVTHYDFNCGIDASNNLLCWNNSNINLNLFVDENIKARDVVVD